MNNRTYVNRNRRNYAVLASLVGAFILPISCLEAFWQQPKDEPDKQEMQNEEIDYSDYILPNLLQEIRVNVDVNDIPVSAFVAALRKQSPAQLNIIVKPDAANVRLPEIQLHQVTIEAAMNALFIATNETVIFQYDESEEFAYISRDQDVAEDSDVGVFNLSRWTEPERRESLLSAIDIGLEMLGSDKSNVKLKLHDKTNMLFAKGTAEELRLVEEIITSWSIQQPAQVRPSQ